MKVGFIGLGRMGSGMARRVMSGGHALGVFDVNRAQVQVFAGEGAEAMPSVAAVGAASDVVITMLVEDAAVLDVVLGADGLAGAMPQGSVHLAMGTYGVATIRRLEEAHAAAGQVLVAAPVPRAAGFRRGRAAGRRGRRPRGRGRTCGAAAAAHWQAHLPRRAEAGIVDRDQAGEQRRPRVRDGGDGRGLHSCGSTTWRSRSSRT